ncbi:MAG: hypothetical protein LBQ31_08805 [Bacteroidales bacterium]|nr:hypothetical protein [Bacteroidales bacterium]
MNFPYPYLTFFQLQVSLTLYVYSTFRPARPRPARPTTTTNSHRTFARSHTKKI